MAYFATVGIQKVNTGGVLGVQREENRRPEDRDKYNFKASDIDWDRTEYNKYLVKADNWRQAIKAELKENGITATRKDAVLLIDTIYGASRDFFDSNDMETTEAYLIDCLDYHQRHYGHVINAVIHYDETTPHLHVVSVPIVDREDGRHSLSARDLVGWKWKCTSLQTSLHDEVGIKYDLDRGENREIKRKHIDTMDFKRQETEKQIMQSRDSLYEIELKKITAQRDIEKLESRIGCLEKLEGIIDWLVKTIPDIVKGIRAGIDKVLEDIEAKLPIFKHSIEHDHVKMQTVKDTMYMIPVYRDTPLTWGEVSPAYTTTDGDRYDPVALYADNQFYRADEWQEIITAGNRDPVSVPDVDRLEEAIDKCEMAGGLLDLIEDQQDSIDRRED